MSETRKPLTLTLAERLAGKCKHFNGTMSVRCKAGVEYASVRTRHDPLPSAFGGMITGSLPCKSTLNPGGATCDRLSLPTAEEVAAAVAEIDARFERTGKCREAIVAHLGGPWKKGKPGAAGAINCPACGGKASLRFTRSSYNGHIHAACTTDGCANWME